MRGARTLVCLLLLGCGAVAARTQEEQQPAPAEAPESPRPAARKLNTRPAEAAQVTAIEPFDGATAAKMAEKCVTLETEAGQIEIEMLPGAAPESVRNFLNLTATGFFDTTTFNRVVKGFVIQGGNVTTRQTVTPALLRRAVRTIPDEPGSIKHERGIVSMARAESPNSATTNFFILVGAAPHLDGRFAAFGRVTQGMEVVDAINQAPADGEKPERPVQVRRASIKTCAPASDAPPAAKPAN